MKTLGRGLALLAFLATAIAAREGEGDVRKVKAYLKEVKRHLLESYIDRERLKDDRLVAAALKGMGAALDHPDFATLDKDTRAAVKEALREAETLDAAVEAVDGRAPGIDLVRLADHAAQAMIRETGDPFSRLLTDKDMEKLLRIVQGGGREETAGCTIQMKDDRPTVYYVQYGTPAFEEGLEIGDEVLEVRGKKSAGTRLEELNDLLRLPAGQTLELKVRRQGHDYDFRLTQRRTSVPDVRYQYLGQGVGYLRMTLFDLNLVREVRGALREMAKAGMKGLILDLRHNPGGALPAATGVADLFLPQGLLIAKTISHYRPSLLGIKIPGFGLDGELKTSVKSEFETMPMVSLVNRASASASELLAGALQDHKRAVLIGERTYGKGVGQAPIILSSMLMKRYLYLTVMRYTTPNGHEVEQKGVAPDIEFRDDPLTPERFGATWKLRRSGDIERYLDAHWGATMRRLAEKDAFETGRYEGFDALYRSLDTRLTGDEVREELRRAARRRMADEGTVWVCDLQTDKVLQRGLVELLDRLEKHD